MQHSISTHQQGNSKSTVGIMCSWTVGNYLVELVSENQA